MYRDFEPEMSLKTGRCGEIVGPGPARGELSVLARELVVRRVVSVSAACTTASITKEGMPSTIASFSLVLSKKLLMSCTASAKPLNRGPVHKACANQNMHRLCERTHCLGR